MENINLGELGFYWRMTDSPNQPVNVVPDFVPFEFEFREAQQLIAQKNNTKTWEHLERIYRENYNVGYLQEGHALALGYGNDFLEFIDDSIRRFGTVKKIYEIGAGGCYILKKLKEQGYEVAAIDPSPIAILKGKEFGIEVIPEFYPPKNEIPKSDLILHYDVLEHVQDPVAFIKSHAQSLLPGGLILFVVPDCSEYIKLGDVSMILHEHINYFDEESLQNVVEQAGFEVLNLKKGNFGGVLCCVARLAKETLHDHRTNKKDSQKFIQFSNKQKALFLNIERYVREALKEPKSEIGFYVPLRAVPYLSMLKIKERVRFFDDDPGIHNKYFDGFKIPVENFKDLCANPPSHMIVTSFAFGEKIKSKILNAVPKGMDCKSLRDFSY